MIRSSRCLHQQFSRSTSNHQDSAHHVRVSTGGKRKHGAVANLCRFQPLLEPVNRIRYSPLSTMEPEGDDDVIDWDTALEEIVRFRLVSDFFVVPHVSSGAARVKATLARRLSRTLSLAPAGPYARPWRAAAAAGRRTSRKRAVTANLCELCVVRRRALPNMMRASVGGGAAAAAACLPLLLLLLPLLAVGA